MMHPWRSTRHRISSAGPSRHQFLQLVRGPLGDHPPLELPMVVDVPWGTQLHTQLPGCELHALLDTLLSRSPPLSLGRLHIVWDSWRQKWNCGHPYSIGSRSPSVAVQFPILKRCLGTVAQHVAHRRIGSTPSSSLILRLATGQGICVLGVSWLRDASTPISLGMVMCSSLRIVMIGFAMLSYRE